MISTKRATTVGAAFFAVPAALVLAAGPAAAAGSGDVLVSNTETVQAYLNASGKLDVARIYDQIAMQGKGKVDLVNPVETKGLRNLDKFGGFEVKDGNMVGSFTVDGEKRLRAVSDYTKRLPLEVDVKYSLDGKTVKPGDVVGKSGVLKVQYTVRNVTGIPQEVSFNDGTGKQATATEDVVIPMIGSLSTVLPSTFTDVQSGEANMAGDGRGGTKMSFTMTLFGPIGKPEATFGYTARISNGVIPKASISALPVSPLDSPSFKGGAASYKAGAETGATLTAGATEIDANLLKLRDGAGDLLAGLIKLRDGASELNAGLAGKAAPGAAKLADGAGQLKDGTGKLAAGANDAKEGANALADGSAQVADGLEVAGSKAPALIAGLDKVAAGLELVDGGLTKLHGGIGGLPAKAQPLHAGIQQMIAGLGSKSNPATLIGGIDALQQQVGSGGTNLIAIAQGKIYRDGATKAESGSYQKINCAVKVATDLRTGRALGTLTTAEDSFCYGALSSQLNMVGIPAESNVIKQMVLTSLAAELANGRDALADPDHLGDPTSATFLDGPAPAADATLQQALTYIGGRLKYRAVPGLMKIECGLSMATLPGVCDPTKPGLLEGLGGVDAGVTQLVNGVVAQVQGGIGAVSDTPTDQTLRGGINGLQDGVGQLQAGGSALEAGLGQLAAGAGLVAEGNAALADGVGQIAGGATKLDDGADQLKDGANQLSSGLGDAADGSGKLADGLGQAAEGAPKLQDGAQRLSDEGTKKLVAAGKSTAADYGQKYALIEAGAKRAKTEAMAYGAPQDSLANMAYSYEIAGADGEGGRNLGRGFGALAVLALAGAVPFIRRRFV